MNPHVYQLEGMILVPEPAMADHIRIKRKRENRLPVVRKNGVRIGIYPLRVLNAMWGMGWFLGAVKNGVLRLLILQIPLRRFNWELERVTGELPLSHSESRRLRRWLLYKYSAGCGKEKHRDEFPLGPVCRSDALGNASVCRGCAEDARRRAASTSTELRRVREAYAGGWHSDAEWNVLLDKTGRRCLRCGSEADLTKDHVVPLSRGGTHDIENLQPLCRRCNSWKNDRVIDFRDNPVA